MSNTPRKGIVHLVLGLAVLGVTFGCSDTPTPVAPAPNIPLAPPAVVATVTAGASTVGAGGPLSVSWTTSAGGHNDWIALFKKGDPDNFADSADYGWSKFTDGATSGTFTLTAPVQPGEYEFRYLIDDNFVDIARSSVVTVG